MSNEQTSRVRVRRQYFSADSPPPRVPGHRELDDLGPSNALELDRGEWDRLVADLALQHLIDRGHFLVEEVAC